MHSRPPFSYFGCSLLSLPLLLFLNPVDLDPRLPEASGPEPGWEDELRRGEAAAPDDQHRPERAVRPLSVQGQRLLKSTCESSPAHGRWVDVT